MAFLLFIHKTPQKSEKSTWKQRKVHWIYKIGSVLCIYTCDNN